MIHWHFKVDITSLYSSFPLDNDSQNKIPQHFDNQSTYFHCLNPINIQGPYNRVLHEKLITPRLVKKFPAFCGTWRFIAIFTTAQNLALSRAKFTYCLPSCSIHSR